jgi:hypothetical protein
VAVVAPALALQRDDPPKPNITFVHPERISSITTSWGQLATLWNISTADGGTCRMLQLDEPTSTPAFDERAAGGGCSIGPEHAQDRPLDAAVSWIRLSDGTYGVLMTGSLAPGTRVAALKLTTPDGDKAIAPSERQFVVELPSVSAAGRFPAALLLGYDDGGQQVATFDPATVTRRP